MIFLEKAVIIFVNEFNNLFFVMDVAFILCEVRSKYYLGVRSSWG
jgi:hypothetical protein